MWAFYSFYCLVHIHVYRCLTSEGECEKLREKSLESKRKLDDTQAALQELGRENQSLQVRIYLLTFACYPYGGKGHRQVFSSHPLSWAALSISGQVFPISLRSASRSELLMVSGQCIDIYWFLIPLVKRYLLPCWSWSASDVVCGKVMPGRLQNQDHLFSSRVSTGYHLGFTYHIKGYFGKA